MRQINQCINQQLSTVLSAALKLENYEQQLLKFLPHSLKSCCKLVSYKQGRMMIGIDNPALAAELRFFLPKLRDILRSDAGFYQLAMIESMVLQRVIPSNPLPKKRPYLSDSARQEILKAVDLTEYEPLKKAWRNFGLKIEEL